jgi:uncharacterized protein YecT (DUF1311 family)
MKRFSVAVALGFFLCASGIGNAASIDCHEAKTDVEKLICADEQLMAADYELSYYYEALLSVSREAEEVRHTQLAWLKKRNKCKDTNCIEQAYSDKRQEIGEYLRRLPAARSERLATEEYFGKDDVYADAGDGRKELIGKYFCCVKVERSTSMAFIEFMVSFPDMRQVLTAKVPASLSKNGALNFRFVDGWSNRGKGSFLRTDRKFLLNLEEVEPAQEPLGRNILRMYGEYLLSPGKAGICEQLSSESEK